MLLISSETWPFAMNIEPRCANLSTPSTIEQKGLAMFTRDECCVNTPGDCGGIVLDYFKLLRSAMPSA